ncbi:MAG: ABC transporter ATP-binding protein [Ruminococcaceae bacterium]|nr:ABC transporter ATP-binding protein [Oscillospiraceae bacterium]
MKNLRKFSKYYKPYIGIIILDLLCAAVTSGCELAFPMIVRQITGEALVGNAEYVIMSVLRLGLLYLALRMIDVAANYYMAYIGHVMGARLETDMRRDLFAHLQELPFSFYDNTKIGQLMSRVTNDLFEITEFSHHCPEEFFIAGVKILGAFVLLLGINIPLTLIIFAMLPLMLLSVFLFRSKMRNAFKKSREQVGELNSDLEDSLLGVRVVKSFANETVEREKFGKGNNKFLEIKSEAYKYMARFSASTKFFEGLMYVAVVVVGAIFMVDGKITTVDLIAYLLYIQSLLTSIRRIVEFIEQFQKGTTGIDRFLEIMEVPVGIEDKEDAVELGNINGKISFENVTFSYGENGNVLSDFNLEIKPGESVALVGPSGAGKTTVCNLIPRFYETTNGKISIDDINIKDVTLKSLRSNIGIVQQDVYLFSGTIAENIAYGKVSASKEEIEEAAKAAGAHEFISQLPDGYDTYVGERGVKLSGGQKQRISIARLFLKNPPIVILDEATSALDNESERLVQKSLELLAKGRTTITIAHRLTTIKNADRIVYLCEDGIKEQGSHNELLSQNGEYAKLYSLYQ